MAGLPPLRPDEPPLQPVTNDATAINTPDAAGGSIDGMRQSGNPAVTKDAAPAGSSLCNDAATAAAVSAADAAESAGDAARVPTSRTPNGYVRSGLPDTFRRAGPVLTEAEAADQVRR